MSQNRGQTSLKCKRRAEHPMTEYDRLPTELRVWLASAVLPWRARSVRKAYDKAVLRSDGDTTKALAELDALQARLIAKDAVAVWGDGHPAANG